MLCCYYDNAVSGGDTSFSVDTSHITFGPGCLSEAGDVAASLGIRRIGVMTDAPAPDTRNQIAAGLEDCFVRQGFTEPGVARLKQAAACMLVSLLMYRGNVAAAIGVLYFTIREVYSRSSSATAAFS